MLSRLFVTENTAEVVIQILHTGLDHILKFSGTLAQMARDKHRHQRDGGKNDPHTDHFAGHIQNPEKRNHNAGFTHSDRLLSSPPQRIWTVYRYTVQGTRKKAWKAR